MLDRAITAIVFRGARQPGGKDQASTIEGKRLEVHDH
jgi:hypothetical protein